MTHPEYAYFDEVSRQGPLLTKEQEQSLGLRIRQGDREALNELVRHNLRLVVSLARRMAWRCKGDMDELVSVGNKHLMYVASRFDPDKGRFTTLALASIARQMNRAIMRQAIRATRQRPLSEEIAREAAAPIDDDPHFWDTVGEAAQALAALPARHRFVITRRFGLDGNKPQTLDALGADMGLTKERVRQLQNEGLKAMREGMKEC